MSRSPGIRRFLRIRRSVREQASNDVEREVAFHLQMRIDELAAEGLSEDEARSLARREFGDGERMRARLRRAGARTERSRRWTELLLGQRLDVRFALRRLRREPGFALIGGATLAVGIGATAAIFTVLDGVLLQPLPFRDGDRLVALSHAAPGLDVESVPQATGTYFTYREEARTLEDVAVWHASRVTLADAQEPREIPTLTVTEGFLPLLRVSVSLGRAFGGEDVEPGRALTTIVSHRLWLERLGGARDAIGHTIRLDGREYEVIGVLPAGFSFLENEPDALLPYQFDRSNARITDFSYEGLGRLAPGATRESALAELTRLLPVSVERFPRGLSAEMLRQIGMRPVVRPLKDVWVGQLRGVLWILFGTVGLVLLIACANVAGLFLVRAEGRQREIAVQRALGASRARAARTYVLESLAFGLLSGAVGLALAWAGVRLLAALGPSNLPRLRHVSVGPATILLTLALSALAGLCLGLIPMVRSRVGVLSLALREGGRGSGDGKQRHASRNALVVAQIAMALVLLVGSGLMVRSFIALRDVDPGFDRDTPALTFRLGFPRAIVPDIETVVDQYQAIERALESLPGVDAAAFVNRLPMDEAVAPEDALFVEDFPVPEGQLPPIRRFKWVSGDYFDVAGLRLLAGRAIDRADIETRAGVVVISRSIADEYWDDPRDAIGKRVQNEWEAEHPEWREIVGVVADVHDDGLDRDPVGIVYWPAVVERFWGSDVFAQRSSTFLVRTPRAGRPGFVDEVQRAVWSVNRSLPLVNLRTLDEVVRSSTTRTSFTLVILALAAAIALFLGSVGLYGVISYAVSTRRREIGVRIALGAGGRTVTRMVLREGLALAVVGVVLGVALSVGLTRLMTAVLYGVAPVDPLTYGITALGLVGVAALASWVPARRAAGVDPMRVLRHE